MKKSNNKKEGSLCSTSTHGSECVYSSNVRECILEALSSQPESPLYEKLHYEALEKSDIREE